MNSAWTLNSALSPNLQSGHLSFYDDVCEVNYKSDKQSKIHSASSKWAFIIYTRNFPVLGRWFEFQPVVWLSLSHFGIEGHPNHLWASNVESIPFRRRRPPRPLLGRSGCAFLIPASKSCPRPLRGRSNQKTFDPVGLRLPHSGVEGNQDHFWVGRAVPISFRRRRPPRLLLNRSGKNKKDKKSYGAFWTCDVTPLKVYLT
jgi:hypothetical protein